MQTPSHPGRLPCRHLRAQRGIVGFKGWVFESQSKAEMELSDLTLEWLQSSLSHKHTAHAGSGLAADTVCLQHVQRVTLYLKSAPPSFRDPCLQRHLPLQTPSQLRVRCLGGALIGLQFNVFL